MKIFDYEDIQLMPRKCVVKSRKECDTSIKFGKHSFKMPIVLANMETVINEELAIKLASENYFYIMHRFDEEARIPFIKKMKSLDLISSISVGVKDYEYDFIKNLKKLDLIPDYIAIDIAHGHSDSVINMIKHIKKYLPETFVIAGNVGTKEGVIDLEEAGADSVKVGIGPGKVCTTKLKTGFGTGGWQLSALKECSEVAKKPLIADGGVRHNGDLAKSIRFGASMIMIGSLFAGHDESPGDLITIDNNKYKSYYGSASYNQKGKRRNIEGKEILVPYKGSINETLNEMQQDLQSSISYSGGKNLSSIKEVDYVVLKNLIFNGDY